MAEFFVLKKYRRRGLGREAAFRLFSMFPGEWHVTQQVPNLAALTFGRKVIREYTQCNYHEKVDAEGGEVVQKFLSTKGYSERADV
jgi:predicted acetyltransferase